MGKASRRKRERAEPLRAAADGDRDAGQRSGVGVLRRGMILALAGVGALVLAAVTWQSFRSTDQPTPAIALPAPDTAGMTAPVAEAIESARAAALSNPQSAQAVGRYGQVLHAHWLLEAAEECYAIAHEITPQDFRWTYLRAGVAEILGRDGEQVDRLFREALQQAPPGFAPIHVRYADALMRLGRWPEARDQYGQAIEQDSELVLAHRGLGQALILLGDGAAAVEHLQRAAALSPGDRISRVALARAYAMAGDEERAAEAAAGAESARGSAPLPDPIFFEVDGLAVDPESLRSRYSRSLRQGDVEAAEEAAGLLERSGDPGASRQLPTALKRRANQLAFAGEFDQALAAYAEAARMAPEDPEIEHNWGTVLLRRGNLKAAAQHFEKAIRLNPESADSLYNLGVVMETLGRMEEAAAHFRAAATIDPQHAAAQRLAGLEVSPEP